MKFVVSFILVLISINSIIASDIQVNTLNKILDQFSNKSKKDLFKVWHLLYKKTYALSSDIAKEKFKVFKQNLKTIEAFNSDPDRDTYEMGVGPFTDLTEKEFEELYLNESNPDELENTQEVNEQKSEEDDDDDLTKRFLEEENDENVSNLTKKVDVDHRKLLQGALNQKKTCKSDFAFATTATIEFLYNNIAQENSKEKTKYSFSEQELVDCVKKDGCKGGNAREAFNIIKKDGIESSKSYPYTAKHGKCKSPLKQVKKIDQIIECKEKKQKNKVKKYCGTDQTYALLKRGVGVVKIDGKILQHYKKGVISKDNKNCKKQTYWAALVAYKFPKKGKKSKAPYWVVRTSLGKKFGEKGHVKFAAETSNHACFVQQFIILPVKVYLKDD